MKARTLRDAVVVITGASSGIGRATAERFAREGARLVLAARDRTALDEVVAECARHGVTSIAVPTDVTDVTAVEALADTAIQRFGRIDVWVNDAAVYLMGSVEQTPVEAFRRAIEVNYLGTVHGAKAALRAFRTRQSGVLINVGSVAGKVGYAQASAYCATKHAVHGFTEVLRQELLGTDIHACVVAPATVDTPLFQHAANFTGRTIEAMRPIYPAERVAEAIVDCAKRPQREVLVGAAPRAMATMQTLAPGAHERAMPGMVSAEHLGSRGVGTSRGNLFAPVEPHRVDGGWRARKSTGRKIAGATGAVLASALLVLGVGWVARSA